MKNYTDHSINHNKSYISGIWNIPVLKEIFLGDCAISFPIHAVNNFVACQVSCEVLLSHVCF